VVVRRGAAGAFSVAGGTVTIAGDWEGLPTREDLALADLEDGTALRLGPHLLTAHARAGRVTTLRSVNQKDFSRTEPG